MTYNHESRRFDLPRFRLKPKPPAQCAVKFLTKIVDYVKTVSIAARLLGLVLQNLHGNEAAGSVIVRTHLIIWRIAELEKTSSKCGRESAWLGAGRCADSDRGVKLQKCESP